MGCYALYDALKHHSQPGTYGVALACIALFGLMGSGSISYLIATFTIYEADDSQIIQRSLFHIRRMQWRDVVKLNEGSGTADSSMTLTDNGGQKLLGDVVEVDTSDNWQYLYTISEVRRHIRDLNDAFADTQGHLWLQTSEGPSDAYPKLQVVAEFLSAQPTNPNRA